MKIRLGAEGLDVEALVQEVRDEVTRRRAAGDYADARIGRAERHNLLQMAPNGRMHETMLRCLDECSQIDINDYEIEDRNPGWKGRALVKLKTVIWKLLKFYTFRLWFQQNQVNALVVTALESQSDFYERRIRELESRLASLETASGNSPESNDA